jgi:hypothetical protein
MYSPFPVPLFAKYQVIVEEKSKEVVCDEDDRRKI